MTKNPNQAKFIWYDREGKGRNLYGLFRKSFEIRGRVKTGEINLFGDKTYLLYINGQFVNFGPVRFDPRFPLYDTYDLTNYLQPGRNVIAVCVNYYGFKTYKSIPSQAGLIAWGNVITDTGETVSLDTVENSWKCLPSGAHRRYAPKLSFALHTAELYDQSGEETGWFEPDFKDQHWPGAQELNSQETWGPLAPRNISMMSGRETPLGRVIAVVPLIRTEEWHSFTVPLPHYYEEKPTEFSDVITYSTWIHSPVDQVVNAGVFWGESWLNGKPLPEGIPSPNRNLRYTQRWELKKGWNYFFGKVKVYLDGLYHYLALPSGKGLTVVAEKNLNSAYSFKHSPILSKDTYDACLKKKTYPYGPDETLKEVGGWVYVSKDAPAHHPCFETGWDEYGDPTEKPQEELTNRVFSLTDYPEGFALIIDLEQTRLVLPRLRLEGVKGATVDFTYSEFLKPDGLHFMQAHHYLGGDRMICYRNVLDWIAQEPRGMRYVKLTVRNPQDNITLKSLSLRSANYPVSLKGSFLCSDPCLNEVWRLGVRTVATNMEDVYVDCPGRERGMYGRDVIIQYHINLAAFGDHALMNRCLELYGQSPDATGKFRAVFPNTGDYTISDFSLNLVEGYLFYYENTGDKTRIAEDWDAIINNLRWFHQLADERDDLLLDAEWDKRRGIKSHYGGFHGDLQLKPGYMDNTGIHCAFSCTYLIALQSAIKLARVLGREEDTTSLEERVKILFHSIPTMFWNDKFGCFSDNQKRTTHSAHANLLAVRAGVVGPERMNQVRKHVDGELQSIFVNGFGPEDGVLMSPSYAFYLLDGLYRAGMEETAERIIRQGWGWMLANGHRTCPEYFVVSEYDSLCHAWSGSPTYFLSRYLLGVCFPKAPNPSEVAIRVRTHGVSWAQGAYPHPWGLVEVKWHMEDGKRVFDYVKVPDGVKVTVME